MKVLEELLSRWDPSGWTAEALRADNMGQLVPSLQKAKLVKLWPQ
jgi:hypothetical protein